jgi:hypothetical protein
MTALQAHPAVRLPVGRLAPMVVGAAALAAAIGVALTALLRPGELATAVVAGGSVVLGVGAMYAALGLIRTRYLVSLTTIFMGLSMVRLVASVAIGVAYMVTGANADGGRPDKFVFAMVFLGASLAVIAVETVLIRAIIRTLGESIARAALGPSAASDPSPAEPSVTSNEGAAARGDRL